MRCAAENISFQALADVPQYIWPAGEGVENRCWLAKEY